MAIASSHHWWGTAIEAPDPQALALFYAQLVGWPTVDQSVDHAVLSPPQDGVFVVVQRSANYVAPVWPPVDGSQRPMAHFDFQVEDLDAGVAEAVSLGARLADEQPNEKVRVLFDPAGHPFCLCLDE